MLELFSQFDTFLSGLKCDGEVETLKDFLKVVLEPLGFSLDLLTKNEFIESLPLFMIKPCAELTAEIILVTFDHRLLHSFFFDFVTNGIIEKKVMPILRSTSIRFSCAGHQFFLLTAKTKFSSELELSLSLENFPEYMKKIELGSHPISSKTVSQDHLHFAREIKRGIVVDRFLRFCERFNLGSRFDAWAFSTHRLNELEFILGYQPEYAKRILMSLYQHFLIFSGSKGQTHHKSKLKTIKIKNEFQSDFDHKLACILTLGLQHQYEIFDKESFVKLLHQTQDKICVERIQEIHFTDFPQNHFKTFYVECRFSLNHLFEVISIKKVQELLLKISLQSVKQMTLPLFKPRNEEEVLKDFVMLSKQLTHPTDIPQVIVHFDHHDLHQLLFRVILIRVKKVKQQSLLEDLALLKQVADITIERIKTIGFIRKKLPKEACVISYRLGTKEFIRDDYTIDFQQSRLVVMENLMKVFGPIRDFEGGMIAKHAEAFKEFQTLVLEKAHAKLITLENFFYGICPAEYRSLIPIESILEAFFLWKKDKTKKRKETAEEIVFFLEYPSENAAKNDLEFFQEANFKIHEGFFVKFTHEGVFFLGVFAKGLSLKQKVKNHFGFVGGD
jgi:hypothetical protein